METTEKAAATNEPAELRLLSLTLRNFRIFSSLEMSFHPQLTVLVARNGFGKTSVLDAIAKVLAVFVGRVEKREKLATRLWPGDVHSVSSEDRSSREPRFPVDIQLQLQHEGVALRSELKRESFDDEAAREATSDPLPMLGDKLYQRVLAFAEGKVSTAPTLPLIAYYGTERLWGEKDLDPVGERDPAESSRLWGYRECLVPDASKRVFKEWFKKLSLVALQNKKVGSSSYFPEERLLAVQNAVAAVLQDANWGKIRWDLDDNDMEVENLQYGWFPVSHTSDGVTNIISFVADMARRCVCLNPQFKAEAAQKTPGIVLIDEVDMHLHPDWQQRILGSLRDAFPRIQFVVTTHSPHVLSSIPRENVRIIGQGVSGQMIAEPPLAQTYGQPSGDVLHSVMSVDPQPPVKEKPDMQRLISLVDQGHYESAEAQQLLSSLTIALGKTDSQLLKVERSIRRQKVLGR